MTNTIEQTNSMHVELNIGFRVGMHFLYCLLPVNLSINCIHSFLPSQIHDSCHQQQKSVFIFYQIIKFI